MVKPTSRRGFLVQTAGSLPLALLPAALSGEEALSEVASTVLEAGDLKVQLRDNSHSPRVLSGLASLLNQKDAPGFDAIDPDSPGASAGLNFEHIISGHANKNNKFTPRDGTYSLIPAGDGKSAALVREHEDDPWAVSSRLEYRVQAPYYVDFDFRCVPHDASLFGEREYAILFFANYMNDVEDVSLVFRGIDAPGGMEKWIQADAPTGHVDWNGGGTYRSADAIGLEYDADHDFKLNSWSYDYPRFTKPFYYGRAAHGMVFQLMFDKMVTPREAIRFSLFKFKLPRFPRPAWDYQYVIYHVRSGEEYGFRGRLVWKKFVSADDCSAEYDRWAAAK